MTLENSRTSLMSETEAVCRMHYLGTFRDTKHEGTPVLESSVGLVLALGSIFSTVPLPDWVGENPLFTSFSSHSLLQPT